MSLNAFHASFSSRQLSFQAGLQIMKAIQTIIGENNDQDLIKPFVWYAKLLLLAIRAI